jgi:hypothetical protein
LFSFFYFNQQLTGLNLHGSAAGQKYLAEENYLPLSGRLDCYCNY